MHMRILSLFLALSAAACSGPYLGIDRASLDPSAQALLDRASAGDKEAQFRLGILYTYGNGVPSDCQKAFKLLRQAASRSGGTTWIYSPPVAKGGRGRVIPFDQGPKRAGLDSADSALRELTESAPCD